MRIIKRKKGNEEYFYLQHSHREEGKVITQEKYLGKKVPADIAQIKAAFRGASLKVLYKKLEKIRQDFQKEWKRIPDSVKEKEKQEIAIAFTYNTNAIEGSTITLQEAREIIEDHVAPRKSLRDIKETEAHAKVFLEMLEQRGKVTNNLLLQWHKEIFGETKHDIAGRWREYLVKVGNYRAPDWQDVKKLMKELIVWLQGEKMNVVELAARAHYRFEKVHPFGDGNGRVGRLLMNKILWDKGYPMLIIEYKRRRSYYRALEKEEEGFVKYFLRRYVAVHKQRTT